MAAKPDAALTTDHSERHAIRLTDLVAQIYESAGDPDGLSAFIRNAATYFRAQYSAVGIWSKDDKHGILSVTNGMTTEELTLLFDRRHEPGTLFSRLDQLQSGEAIVSVARSQSTSTAADSANKFEAMHSLAGVAIVDNARPCAIILFRPNQLDEFSAAEQEAVASLMNYYQRAFDINKRFIQIFDERIATRAALEYAPRGIVFLGKSGQVVYRNNSAQLILDKKDGLRRNGNHLRIDDSAAQKKLEAFISMASSRAEHDRPSSVIFKVPRPSRGSAYQLIVSEIPGSRRRSALNDDELIAMAVIHNPDDLVDLDAKYLRTFYELSAAEARLAQALYKHNSLARAAKSLSISINTARSELKNIFRKVGVNSQSALLVEFAKALKD